MGDFRDDKVPAAKRMLAIKALQDDSSEVGEILLIASGEFFLQRDKKMEPKKEFAPKVLEALVAQQKSLPSRHVVVCLHESQDWMRPYLESAGVEIFRVKDGQLGETMVRLKARLQKLGVKFRPIRNSRAVSYLNIDRFAMGKLRVIRPDDYEGAGIEPEKEVTFLDMAKKRRRDAWP